MTEKWPPEGMFGVYDMDVQLELPKLSYSAQVTVAERPNDGPSDVASFRYERLGGTTAEDLEFRNKLYLRIGAITVAGGHAEAAMKRVILSGEEKGEMFDDVDLTWSALVKRLEKLAGSDRPLGKRLTRILEWSHRHQLKKRRDDAVHSYWWHWAGVGVSRSRFTRDGQSYVVPGALSELERLDRDAAMIFEYARRMDDLVVSQWPQARLVQQSSVFYAGDSSGGDLRYKNGRSGST